MTVGLIKDSRMKKLITILFITAAVLCGCTEKEPEFVPGQGSTETPGEQPGDNPGEQPETPPDEPVIPDPDVPEGLEWPVSPTTESYSGLTSSNHPRLFMDDNEFAVMKKRVEANFNPLLVLMHEEIMKMAEYNVERTATITRVLEGRRMLSVSKTAIIRILTCAYAFRYTGDRKYLEHAEKDINDVCAFSDWNAGRHTLDTAEMTAGVALGYDWLYWDLSVDTRKKVQQTIKAFAFDQVSWGNISLDFYSSNNNWNQVCNGGMVLGALAIYETYPDVAKGIIDAAKRSNPTAMKVSYAPDGNYPEGPGYWDYGTLYQTLMMTALETTIGVDYNMSKSEGFSKTCDYALNVVGSLNKVFNYSDNVEGQEPSYSLWYFAEKFNRPELLVFEKRLLEDGRYYNTGSATGSRFLPVIITYAARMSDTNVSAPSEKLYVGKGEVPVATVHKTWTAGSDDIFLGIKGGAANANHAHMDAGSFVYDDEGVRWSMDLPRESYNKMETALKTIGSSESLFNMAQTAQRWHITRMNNHYHSTLTINGAYHKVAGKATITKINDSDAKRGVMLNLSPVFSGEASSVTRDIALLNEKDLQILDEVKATSGKDAKVRWTMITTATPEVRSDCIVLTRGTKKRYLQVSSGNIKVTYKNFGMNPKDFGQRINSYETEYPGAYAVGFEATVPKSSSGSFKTTLSRSKK